MMTEEILTAIGEMKNNKADRLDNIPSEMLKTLGEEAMKELIQICRDIYNTGEWPEDFLQTIILIYNSESLFATYVHTNKNSKSTAQRNLNI